MGEDPEWYVTLGSAYAFGLPRMFGGAGMTSSLTRRLARLARAATAGLAACAFGPCAGANAARAAGGCGRARGAPSAPGLTFARGPDARPRATFSCSAPP